ncbi:melanoma-associated antigen D2 [Bicyclus anynana]|uniref:Melanoma-associated antigen D2 n=1 Tax=Bicyclus anynana TaxID=110368 RepID=A0A6J1NYB4_BICAN|nr:melanoma-associated antigen D2 [Bicyclus anynana]
MSQHRANRSLSENTCSAEVVNQCVKFLVCREGSKIPIRNSDIDNFIESVTKDKSKPNKKVVLENANKVLKSVYGYKLVQLKCKGIQYIMVLSDTLPSSSVRLQPTCVEPGHRKLLIACLTHIFMSGGTVKDIDMWQFLNSTSLLSEHDIQGRKVLTHTFKKQLYLDVNKIGPDDQQKCEFSWGQRADEEIPKEFIINKMAQAFETEPQYWRKQYRYSQENPSNVSE